MKGLGALAVRYDVPSFLLLEKPGQATAKLSCTVLQSLCGKIVVSRRRNDAAIEAHDAAPSMLANFPAAPSGFFFTRTKTRPSGDNCTSWVEMRSS